MLTWASGTADVLLIGVHSGTYVSLLSHGGNKEVLIL